MSETIERLGKIPALQNVRSILQTVWRGVRETRAHVWRGLWLAGLGAAFWASPRFVYDGDLYASSPRLFSLYVGWFIASGVMGTVSRMTHSRFRFVPVAPIVFHLLANVARAIGESGHYWLTDGDEGTLLRLPLLFIYGMLAFLILRQVDHERIG